MISREKRAETLELKLKEIKDSHNEKKALIVARDYLKNKMPLQRVGAFFKGSLPAIMLSDEEMYLMASYMYKMGMMKHFIFNDFGDDDQEFKDRALKMYESSKMNKNRTFKVIPFDDGWISILSFKEIKEMYESSNIIISNKYKIKDDEIDDIACNIENGLFQNNIKVLLVNIIKKDGSNVAIQHTNNEITINIDEYQMVVLDNQSLFMATIKASINSNKFDDKNLLINFVTYDSNQVNNYYSIKEKVQKASLKGRGSFPAYIVDFVNKLNDFGNEDSNPVFYGNIDDYINTQRKSVYDKDICLILNKLNYVDNETAFLFDTALKKCVETTRKLYDLCVYNNLMGKNHVPIIMNRKWIIFFMSLSDIMMDVNLSDDILSKIIMYAYNKNENEVSFFNKGSTNSFTLKNENQTINSSYVYKIYNNTVELCREFEEGDDDNVL